MHLYAARLQSLSVGAAHTRGRGDNVECMDVEPRSFSQNTGLLHSYLDVTLTQHDLTRSEQLEVAKCFRDWSYSTWRNSFEVTTT